MSSTDKFEVLYFSVFVISLLHDTYLINLVTPYSPDSDYLIVYRLSVVCYQSECVVGNLLCERMLHQSQSCTFLTLLYRQSDKKGQSLSLFILSLPSTKLLKNVIILVLPGLKLSLLEVFIG